MESSRAWATCARWDDAKDDNSDDNDDNDDNNDDDFEVFTVNIVDQSMRY